MPPVDVGLPRACEKGTADGMRAKKVHYLQRLGKRLRQEHYSALISACEKGKGPERALEIFGKMQQQGIVPNVITYSALISACEKGII